MIENYKQEELTIDMAKAQLTAILYFIFFMIIFGVPYYFLWARNFTLASYKKLAIDLGGTNFPIVLGCILIGVIVHELLHGMTWATFAKKGFKSISFGVAWKYLAPYCHCNEPLLVKHYILGAIMPGVILGIIPSIMAIISGNIPLFLFGIIFSGAAGGDFMMVNILRKESMNYLVQDHPAKLGCYIYRPV